MVIQKTFIVLILSWSIVSFAVAQNNITETLTPEQQMVLLYKKVAFRNILFCGCGNDMVGDLAVCKHSVEDLMDLIFEKRKSAVVPVDLATAQDFYAWIAQQKDAVLMLSKQGCLPCCIAHAFFSAYLNDHQLKSSVFSMPVQNAHVLAEQGVGEFKKLQGTPFFLIVRDGKIVDKILNDPIAVRRHVKLSAVHS